MEATKTWYIKERAEQLALVYLSRRDDLVITKSAGSDYGLDFLVSIGRENEYTGRMFGIRVSSRLSLKPVYQRALDVYKMNIKLNKISGFKDIPFPLCLFVFAMENDEGYYRWIKKPVTDPEGTPKLLFHKANIFKKLTRKEFDNIVAQVNLWYDKKTQ